MSKRKTTKKSLLSSVISLIICVSMLIGTTFAWFTDSVSSGVNRIQAGNLDVEVYHTNAHVTNDDVQGDTELFRDKNGDEMQWEPGAVAYETFTVENKGSLAFKYNMKLHIDDYNAVVEENGSKTLKDVLKVKVLTGDRMMSSITRENVASLSWSSTDPTLDSFCKEGGKLYPATSENISSSSEKFQVVVYWMPTDNDNAWNVNNGKTTSDGSEALFIKFGIDLVATQLQHESDSFGTDYDKDLILADLPKNINKVFETEPLILSQGSNSYNGTESVQVLNKSTNEAIATMPAAAANAVGNALVTKAESDRADDSDLKTTIMFDIQTESATENTVVYNIEATAKAVYTDSEGNTQTQVLTAEETDAALTIGNSITVVPINIGTGLKSVVVKHNGVEMNVLSSASQEAEGYFYDPGTGILTIKSITFSPFAISFESTSEPVASVGNKNFAKLEYAIAAVGANETITVNKSVDERAFFDDSFIGKTVTLDLGGNTVAGVTAFAGNITVENGTLSDRTNAYDSSTLTLKSDVIVNNNIVVWGDGTFGEEACKTPTLNVYGKINNSTEYAAITTNGTDMSKPNINIYEGAFVTDNDIAIYLPSGKLNITGGTITGATGVYFKSTDMTIFGGTITGNGAKQDYNFNGNGAQATGDAVVIDNCNYPAGVGTVSITGGTFISENADPVGSYAGNGQTEALTGFITGGNYSSKPEYRAVEYKAVLEGDYYVVTKCTEHVFENGVCKECDKLQDTWLNIENNMTEVPEGYSEDGKNVTISTNYGLAWFAKQVNSGNSFSGYTVNLADNIDLLDYSWTPINGFVGTFDGCNHTISNLYVDGGTTGQGFGFFGSSNGYIKNLVIENANVMGNAACGAFVGQGNGLIENCSLIGDVKIGTTTNQGNLPNFNSSYLGGIRGYSFQGKIKDCSVDVNDESIIAGGRQVGGILGFDSYGSPESIVNCSVNGIRVYGNKSVGGIVGWSNSTGVKNCTVRNTVVELSSYADELNTIGLISGTSRCLINDTETIVYENNTVDASARMIVHGETPTFDSDSVLRLYSPYSSSTYVKLGDDKYMFTCYDVTKAMTKGDHITLLNSSSEQVTIPENRTITIDLNGYMLQNNITNSGTLTIQNGKVVGDIANSGTLTIKNSKMYGVVSGNEPVLDNATVEQAVAKVDSEYFMTVQDALDYVATCSSASYKYLYLMKDCTENLTIPATPKIYIIDQGNDLTGEISNNGTLYFGSCSGTHNATIINNGTLNITGGATYDLSKIFNTNGATVSISGGTFSTKPDENWILFGYIAVQDDGADTYTVRLMTDAEAVEADAVARYSSASSKSRKYYLTLQEGIQNGSLHLLKDVTEDVTKNGTIDLYCESFSFTGSLSCPGKTLYVDNGNAILNRIECDTFWGGYGKDTAVITVKSGTAAKIIVAQNAMVCIEGGNYTGTIEVKTGGTGSLAITGGTFSSDPTTYVDTINYIVTNNADGTWTVTAR